MLVGLAEICKHNNGHMCTVYWKLMNNLDCGCVGCSLLNGGQHMHSMLCALHEVGVKICVVGGDLVGLFLCIGLGLFGCFCLGLVFGWTQYA